MPSEFLQNLEFSSSLLALILLSTCYSHCNLLVTQYSCHSTRVTVLVTQYSLHSTCYKELVTKNLLYSTCYTVHILIIVILTCYIVHVVITVTSKISIQYQKSKAWLRYQVWDTPRWAYMCYIFLSLIKHNPTKRFDLPTGNFPNLARSTSMQRRWEFLQVMQYNGCCKLEKIQWKLCLRPCLKRAC